MEQAERVKHIWVQLPEIDACRCDLCGQVATTTEIGRTNGILDYCEPADLDKEFADLLSET